MTAEQLYASFSDIDDCYLTETMNSQPKRKRSFWITFGCSAAALLLVLMSCISLIPLVQHGFYLSVRNGQFILTTGHETAPPSSPDAALNKWWHGVKFDSVEEMRSDFLTYHFTEEEMMHIDALLEENGGKVEIPNIMHLCKPILPDDVTWSGKVSWSGFPVYSFGTSCSSMVRLSMSVVTRTSFENCRDNLLNYTDSDRLELIEKTQIDDRNATLYRTQSKKNGHVSGFLVYTLTNGDKTIYVEEHYINDYSPSKLSDYISLYIQDNGYFSHVYMDGYETRPTIEWLLSFGMQKCT